MKSFILALILILACPLSASAEDRAQQLDSIQHMREHTLARLYQAQPDAEREIKAAEGYAVFSSGGLALVWVSGGYGHGVAHNNRTGQETYMEMANAGVGIGLGVKDYSTVFVFHDEKSYRDFITTGLDMTGNVDVAAKQDSKGSAFSGAADVLPGVRVYQLTKTGLMAQAMLQGTKYWQDGDLNKH